MDDAGALYSEALKRGYNWAPAGADGLFPLKYPPNRDLSFEKKMRDNKEGIRALLFRRYGVPKTTTAARDAAKDLNPAGKNRTNLIERANSYINSLIAPGQSADPEFPSEPAEMAKEAARFFIPPSATGKAVGVAAGLMGGPEASKLATVGIPAAVGGLTGALSGEGTLGGMAEGALTGGLSMLPRAGKSVYNTSKALALRARTMSAIDDARMADVTGNIVNLPGVWKSLHSRLQKGSRNTWADIFADQKATKEAGARLMRTRDSIANNLDSISQQTVQGMRDWFKQQYKTTYEAALASGGKGNPQLYNAALDAYKTITFFDKLPNRFRSNLDALKIEGAKAFRHGIDASDSMKDGPAALVAADNYNTAMQSITEDLNKIDQLSMKGPHFSALFQEAQDQYSKFAAIRDSADKWLEATAKGQPGEKALIDILRENPRPFQGRLKDSFHDFKEAIRRNAENVSPRGDVVNTDQSSLLQNARMGIHPRSGITPNLYGTIASLLHPFGHYIGTPETVPPLTKLAKLDQFKGPWENPSLGKLGAAVGTGIGQLSNDLYAHMQKLIEDKNSASE